MLWGHFFFKVERCHTPPWPVHDNAAMDDSPLRLVAVLAANAEAQGLHDLRLSPAAMHRLAVRSFQPHLLLCNAIPCCASPEPQLADDAAVVPCWMLRALGLRAGEEVRLAHHTPPHSLLAAKTIELLIVQPQMPAADRGADASHSDATDTDATESEYADIYHTMPQFVLLTGGTAAAPAILTAATRRQLDGVPLQSGCLIGVQNLKGEMVLRVVSVGTADSDAGEPICGTTAAYVSKGKSHSHVSHMSHTRLTHTAHAHGSHPIVPPVCHIPFLPVYISSPCMYHPMCDLILHEQDPT